jgi:hypothetical protein
MSLIPGIVSSVKKGIVDDIVGGIRSSSKTAQIAIDAIQNPDTFMSTIRSSNLPKGGEPTKRSLTSATVVSQGPKDWRISLSVPTVDGFGGPILEPLVETGNRMIFPYTPTVVLSHTANYSSTSPTHTNYAFQNFVSSQADIITLTGEFTVENAKEAQYWVAVLHYLRSVTKMFYGADANAGAPPPIVKLNGYGDYVFKNVPVVVTAFTVDLQPNVDYIEASIGGNGESLQNGDSTTRVPTQSVFSVSVQPIYSRKTTAQFNLSDFVAGKYVENGKGFI